MIVKYLLILLFVCGQVLSAKAGLVDSTNIKRDKFSIGLECSVLNSGAEISHSEKYNNAVLNFGIPIEYLINKHISIGSGIHFIQRNEDIGIPGLGDAVNYDFRFIRIPLNLKFIIKSFYVKGGIAYDFYLDADTYTNYYNNIEDYYDLNNAIFSWVLNCGIEAPLYQKLNGYIDLGINKDLTTFIDNPTEYKFLSYGFTVGVKWKF